MKTDGIRRNPHGERLPYFQQLEGEELVRMQAAVRSMAESIRNLQRLLFGADEEGNLAPRLENSQAIYDIVSWWTRMPPRATDEDKLETIADRLQTTDLSSLARTLEKLGLVTIEKIEAENQRRS